MDIDMYAKILASQGEDPWRPAMLDKKLSHAEFTMLEDIYRGKVLWTGHKFTDWHLFIGLEHPFYSIFRAPRNHEFTRKERIIVLMCMVAISSVVASASTFSKQILDQQMVGTAISLLGGIFITVSSKVMQFMAMCNCKCLRLNHPKLKQCLEHCGHGVMSVWILFSIIAFYLGIWTANEHNYLYEWLIAFCISNFLPYVFKLFGNTMAFFKKYKKDWKRHNEGASPYMIDFADYQKICGTTTDNLKPNKDESDQTIQIVRVKSLSLSKV